MGLGDTALIKDNHVVAAGGVAQAVAAVRAAAPNISLEVECDSLAQVRAAVEAEVALVLLDNMSVSEIAEAVDWVRGKSQSVELEASGGLTLETVRAVAETGVDYVAVGALTHSAPSLDIGLDVISVLRG
jgi:nicotinate-nucleotide pyrophosphorylase (carboxylating)